MQDEDRLRPLSSEKTAVTSELQLNQSLSKLTNLGKTQLAEDILKQIEEVNPQAAISRAADNEATGGSKQRSIKPMFDINNNGILYDKQGQFKLRPTSPIVSQ